MHQGELDFDFNLSVDDVTTSMQHGTLDLADKHARASCDPPPTRTSKIGRSFKRSWVPYGSLSGTNICDETVHFTRNVGSNAICRENTSTRDANGGKPGETPNDNIVMGPALDVQVTSQHGGWWRVDERWFQNKSSQALTNSKELSVYHVWIFSSSRDSVSLWRSLSGAIE